MSFHLPNSSYQHGTLHSSALVGAEPETAPNAPQQLRRSDKRVLFIWLAGGSSQFETWDPKPGTGY